jgi:hypothetical protein
MRKLTRRRIRFLVNDGHLIEFTFGATLTVHCPTLGRCPIVGR